MLLGQYPSSCIQNRCCSQDRFKEQCAQCQLPIEVILSKNHDAQIETSKMGQTLVSATCYMLQHANFGQNWACLKRGTLATTCRCFNPQNMSLSVCRSKYATTYLEVPVDPGSPVVLLDQFRLLKICQLLIRITLLFAILFLYVLVALFSKYFWSLLRFLINQEKNLRPLLSREKTSRN